MDNIYRHVQAMTELSTNLGLIPSEGGYSPMVFSDLRRLQDRLSSTEKGTITSVQAIYVPADDLSDPAVQAISQQLDSVLCLTVLLPSKVSALPLTCSKLPARSLLRRCR